MSDKLKVMQKRIPNKQERIAFLHTYKRWPTGLTYREFRKERIHYYDSMGCWMIFLSNGLVLGVENDGYTHS